MCSKQLVVLGVTLGSDTLVSCSLLLRGCDGEEGCGQGWFLQQPRNHFACWLNLGFSLLGGQGIFPVKLALVLGFYCSQRRMGSRLQTRADARNPGLPLIARRQNKVLDFIHLWPFLSLSFCKPEVGKGLSCIIVEPTSPKVGG